MNAGDDQLLHSLCKMLKLKLRYQEDLSQYFVVSTIPNKLLPPSVVNECPCQAGQGAVTIQCEEVLYESKPMDEIEVKGH